MTPNLTDTYGGMLTQDELAQRYAYINARIKFDYTEEELSFLMGKAPYYFTDYERMENGSRLSDEDIEILSRIFYGQLLEGAPFERDEFYTYQEKRLIRVQKEIKDGMLFYKIIHPWLIRKDKIKVNDPIKFYEIIRKITPYEEQKVKSEIRYVLQRLINRGFFQTKQAPHVIYKEVAKYVDRNITIYPIYLKQVLHDFLHSGKMILKTTNGVMHFILGKAYLEKQQL
ncbi:hypothetical protein [Olivibacter domesticus]|uniref:Uncharacterized protein n=1 Tax=Olivibacter domesticus TaxID=407022 RepID=A0A1H7SEX5_OLID1|nr:hypothetical protein [Olivibacter domesticus]SEL70958.1 hypothetical protein SAMN05661044_03195 [Olivibacter domesticus]